mgnify:FL=1
MDQPSPRRRGRPPHQPTPETRATVAAMVASDKPVADIAAAIGISEPTLRAHYAVELTAARPQINFPFAESPASPSPRPPAAPSRAGRPEHVPTQETRERVEVLIAGGMPTWQIAAAVGVSEPTLRFHYPTELDAGRARKTALVLEAQFRAATEGGNVAAQKAWLARATELQDPPEPSPSRTVETPGKKAAAAEAARTAAFGTDWENLLPH